jgi:hypothetical protein
MLHSSPSKVITIPSINTQPPKGPVQAIHLSNAPSQSSEMPIRNPPQRRLHQRHPTSPPTKGLAARLLHLSGGSGNNGGGRRGTSPAAAAAPPPPARVPRARVDGRPQVDVEGEDEEGEDEGDDPLEDGGDVVVLGPRGGGEDGGEHQLDEDEDELDPEGSAQDGVLAVFFFRVGLAC